MEIAAVDSDTIIPSSPVTRPSCASAHEKDLFETGQHFCAGLGDQYGFTAANGKLPGFAQGGHNVEHHARLQYGRIVALERDDLGLHPCRREADTDGIAGPFAGTEPVGTIDNAEIGRAHV